MKKTKEFFILPFIQILSFAVCIFMYKIFGNGMPPDKLLLPVSLLINIFAGGYLFSKIEDRKIKFLSALFTFFALEFIYILSPFDGNIGVFLFNFMSPITLAVLKTFPQSILDCFAGTVFAEILTIIPIIIVVLSAEIFNIKKKRFKIILLSILSVICIVLLSVGIQSVIMLNT